MRSVDGKEQPASCVWKNTLLSNFLNVILNRACSRAVGMGGMLVRSC